MIEDKINIFTGDSVPYYTRHDIMDTLALHKLADKLAEVHYLIENETLESLDSYVGGSEKDVYRTMLGISEAMARLRLALLRLAAESDHSEAVFKRH